MHSMIPSDFIKPFFDAIWADDEALFNKLAKEKLSESEDYYVDLDKSSVEAVLQFVILPKKSFEVFSSDIFFHTKYNGFKDVYTKNTGINLTEQILTAVYNNIPLRKVFN